MYNAIVSLKDKTFNLIKRILIPFIAVSLAGFLVFLYLNNIEIDEGTDRMYRAIKKFFIFFCVIGGLGFIALMGLAISSFLRSREYYKHHNKCRLNKHIYTFDVVNTTLLVLFCLCCLYPVIYVVAGSFSQGADYSKGGIYFYPRVFTFENYRIVIENNALWKSYLITVSRTVMGTVTALLFTSIVAYAMSRPNLKFKKVFYGINLFTMFFGGGLIPFFLIIKTIGLYDSFWVYIIPCLYSVYNMIVLQNGFKAVSSEIHDAAFVDGAGEMRIFWTIYMPLAKPVLATIVLWLAVGHWNSYFDCMIYTTSEELQTLQNFLLKAIQTSTMTEGMPPEQMERLSPKTISLAAIIISIIPVLCFFPLIRKNFASGIMIGSLKG